MAIKKKLTLKLPLLIQISLLAILITLLCISTYLIFTKSNDSSQNSKERYQVIERIFSSEFHNILYNLHRAIKTGVVGEDINYLIDYLEVFVPGEEQIFQSGESRKDLFKKNNIGEDQNFPLVSCRNGCFIYNKYRGLRSDGKIANIKYAISLRHLSANISEKLGISGFYVIEAPEISSFTGSELHSIPFTSKTRIHEFTSNPNNQLVINSDYNGLSLTSTIRESSENFSRSKYKIFSMKIFNTQDPNLVLLLPTSDFLSNENLFNTLLNNSGKASTALLCIIGIILILRHILKMGSLQARIIKTTHPEIPTFFIRDEFALATLSQVETIRTNRYLASMVKKQEALLEKYTMFDAATALPLRSLFCQEVNNRIQSQNTSADKQNIQIIAVIRFEYQQINILGDDYREILRDVAVCIHRLLKEEDLLGVDEDYKFLVYSDRERNINEVTSILRTISSTLEDRFAGQRKSRDPLVSSGICIRTPDMSVSKTYHNAELALYNAIKNYDQEPVLFSETISCTSLDDLSFADEFEEALIRNRVHGRYQPSFSIDDRSCLCLDVSPFWQTNDGSIIPEEGIYQKLSDVKRLYMLSTFILEQGLGTLRRLDLKKTVCHHVAFNLNRIQLLDPKLPEFLERLTMKYKILPSRIVFTIQSNYINQQDLVFTERLRLLHQSDYKLALRDTAFHAGRDHLSVSFDMIKFGADLLQAALKEESYRNVLRSMVEVAQSNQQTTIVSGITSANEDIFVKSQIMPDALSGSFYVSDMDEISIFTALQNGSMRKML